MCTGHSHKKKKTILTLFGMYGIRKGTAWNELNDHVTDNKNKIQYIRISCACAVNISINCSPSIIFAGSGIRITYSRLEQKLKAVGFVYFADDRNYSSGVSAFHQNFMVRNK